MAVTTYQQALDFLYGYLPTPAAGRNPADNLVRTRALLDALGAPDARLKSVVVAGTKGKGSTSAMIARMAQAAGLRVGLWTSPHLHSYRERIQINGQAITPQALIEAVNRIEPFIAHAEVAAGLPATFAIGFAIAMRYFADNHVDLAVVEVGLGGRFDSANVLTPLVSVVTSISYDHMELLGDTIDQIAMQKAGIAKPHVPLIVAPQPYAALVTVTACAAEAGAPCVVVDDAGNGGIRGSDPADERVRGPIPELFDPYDVYRGMHQSALFGDVQAENTRLAVAAMLYLRRHFTITDDAIAEGLHTVKWPGRFELCQTAAVPVLLDGAHNVDSAQRLVATIRQRFPGVRITLVVGCSRDKDVAQLLQVLATLTSDIILCASRHPRAMRDFAHMREWVLLANPQAQVVGIEEPVDALAFAMHHSQADELVVVTGSLFVVAAAREALGLATEVD
ncbi:MAG: bifunctional folylpolyglutamate synthase/dihydrofolate synthase [Chloroflexaceae bacterium]|nr:bifunctional folylpolyglutamate synthase/dihydrofolate synthase [Chloroflexaceae bacterium]